MAAPLQLKVDFSRAEDLLGRELNGSREINLAVFEAVHHTARHMRTYISKGIRSIYYVKKGDLDASIKMSTVGKTRAIKRLKPHVNPSMGTVTFEARRSLPLSLFGARQNRNFISVRVLKSNRARRIQPGGEQKILATKNGRAAVWMAKGHVLARVEGRNKPLALFGPNFMGYFSRPDRMVDMQEELERHLLARLRHELGRAEVL